MPKILYEFHRFRGKSAALVAKVNEIIERYAGMGYNLTLRQVFYQCVSQDIVPNTQSEYTKLGRLISKARRAGLVDWDAIVDRTRMLRGLSSWHSPADIIGTVAQQYREDPWAIQQHYVEVWFEKDALLGVFERAANLVRVPFFSCRGYTSDSELWAAAQRLRAHARKHIGGNGDVDPAPEDLCPCTVLHFGDHDPSGMDMTRDITDRLHLFGAPHVTVHRVALNMDQIKQYTPPPNPAKDTDSRFAEYRDEYGDSSWELDALDPAVLGALVDDHVKQHIDPKAWTKAMKQERNNKNILRDIHTMFPAVVDFIRDVDA